MFGFERLSATVTAPVVGETVTVLSAAETDETAPEVEMQTPLIAKHPPERSTPASVDVAIALKRRARTPPANVDVAVEVAVR